MLEFIIGAVVFIVVSLFEAVIQLFGHIKNRNVPDVDYKPSESDLELMSSIKEVMLEYFPDGITETLLIQSVEIREKILKEFAEEVGKRYNVGEIIFDYIDSKEMAQRGMASCAGYQDSKNNLIVINIDVLKSNNPEVLKDAIDTILHECRHKLQRCAVLDPGKYGIDKEVANLWARNFSYYINPKADLEGYYMQPVEADARNFATTIMQDLQKEGSV